MKLLIALTLLSLSWMSLSCEPSAPKELNFHVDLEKGIRKFYTSKRLLDDRPSISLENCEGTASGNKYIMIGLGLESLVLKNDIIGFNFTPQEEGIECRLENNPFDDKETAEERFSKMKQKREFFNRCIVMQVTELNEKTGLNVPENQPGCTVKKLSKWSYDFSGPYCYIQPSQKSTISIHLDVKESCIDKDILGQKETILADYNGLLNTYIAGDASGFSSDLTALSTTQMRFSITPPEGTLELSEDFGVERPKWPTVWKGADLYFGEISVRPLGDLSDEIQVPLVANTRCERTCVGNLCSSPCDFSQPIVGEFSLYEVVNGKREFLKLWHDGSVASGQYQGVLYGMGISVPKGLLREGSLYEIEANFREPDLDFSYFQGRVKRELRFERNYIGPLSRTGNINLIPLISTIGRTGDVPEVPLIRNLSFENSELNALSRALVTWQSKLDNTFWPPFYDRMCGTGESSCKDSGVGFVNLTARFELEEKNNGDFDVNLIKGSRKSNIVTDKTWNQESIARATCGNQSDDDDEDDDFDWGDIL
jgi:hypothetical protein